MIGTAANRVSMAEMSRYGLTLQNIADNFGVSRQYISQQLRIAAAEGNIVILRAVGRWQNVRNLFRMAMTPENKCVICGKSCGRRVTCSDKCLAVRVRDSSLRRNGKWSLYATQLIDCTGCGRVFERANFLVTRNKRKVFYCTHRCYVTNQRRYKC